MPNSDRGTTCRALNRHGARCQKRAVSDGLCLVHSGRQSMAELGRKGGRGRTRAVLGIDDKVADDKLRAQAKEALEKALNSDNEAVRLRAAQALYSYRAQAPPVEQRPDGKGGRKVVSLADLIELATETQGMLDGARMQDAILKAAERVHENQATGRRVDPEAVTNARDAPPRAEGARSKVPESSPPLAIPESKTPAPETRAPAPDAPPEFDEGGFDESDSARLKRRYGGEGEWHW